MKEQKRISKQELMKIYGVSRGTIENWHKENGLPLIRISSHSKYVILEDLIEWENSMNINNKLVNELMS